MLELLLEYEVVLVLLDVYMLEIDGFILVELMCGLYCSWDVLIIFLIVLLDDLLCVFKGYEIGVVDFLYKLVVL